MRNKNSINRVSTICLFAVISLLCLWTGVVQLSAEDTIDTGVWLPTNSGDKSLSWEQTPRYRSPLTYDGVYYDPGHGGFYCNEISGDCMHMTERGSYPINSESLGYKAVPQYITRTLAQGDCRDVLISSTRKHFIPSKTAIEWDAFTAGPPPPSSPSTIRTPADINKYLCFPCGDGFQDSLGQGQDGTCDSTFGPAGYCDGIPYGTNPGGCTVWTPICNDEPAEHCANCPVDMGVCSDCPALTNYAAGATTVNIPQTTPGNVATVNCPYGYAGTIQKTCSSVGLWYPGHSGTCTLVTCDPSVTNGTSPRSCTINTSLDHGSTTFIGCDQSGSCQVDCDNGSYVFDNNCTADCPAESDLSRGPTLRCDANATTNSSTIMGSCLETGWCTATCNDGSFSFNNNCREWLDCGYDTHVNGDGETCTMTFASHGATVAGTCGGDGACMARCYDGVYDIWYNSCTPAVPCGNGVWDAGEECDESSGDSNCTACVCDSGWRPDGSGNCECDGTPPSLVAPYIDQCNPPTCNGSTWIHADDGNMYYHGGEFYDVCDWTVSEPCAGGNAGMECTVCTGGWVQDVLRYCPEPNCGNGSLDAGEECDGGLGCNAACDCELPYKTNGTLACEMISCTGTSVATPCTTAFIPGTTYGSTSYGSCGSGCSGQVYGVCQADGNFNITNACVADPLCGNGTWNSGSEQCDPSVGGTTNCSPSCTCNTGYLPSGSGTCNPVTCNAQNVSTSCGTATLPSRTYPQSSSTSCPGSCTGTVSGTCSSSGTFTGITNNCTAIPDKCPANYFSYCGNWDAFFMSEQNDGYVSTPQACPVYMTGTSMTFTCSGTSWQVSGDCACPEPICLNQPANALVCYDNTLGEYDDVNLAADENSTLVGNSQDDCSEPDTKCEYFCDYANGYAQYGTSCILHCGNDICEGHFGETVDTCPLDCTETPECAVDQDCFDSKGLPPSCLTWECRKNTIQGGTCILREVDCADNNPCTIDTCVVGIGCIGALRDIIGCDGNTDPPSPPPEDCKTLYGETLSCSPGDSSDCACCPDCEWGWSDDTNCGYTNGPCPCPPHANYCDWKDCCMFAYWKRYPVYIDGECGCMNIVERQAHGEGCFDPDVMIQMEDKSWKKAGNLFEGDKVYNPVLDVGVEITSIVAGPEVKPMIEVGFGDKTIVVTDTHPLMTADGLKQAKNLTMDDKLIDDRGKERKITILHTMATKKGQMVINLILDVPEGYDKDFHMINANGIVSGDWTLQEKLSSEE